MFFLYVESRPNRRGHEEGIVWGWKQQEGEVVKIETHSNCIKRRGRKKESHRGI
jgi:hypothetical protein